MENENKILTEQEIAAREEEKINEINESLSKPTTAIATINENTIEILLKADLKKAIETLDSIEFAEDVETAKSQHEAFKQAELSLVANRKLYFNSLEEDKKNIMNLEKTFKRKKEEAQKNIDKLLLEETLQYIADVKVAFKLYFEEKETKSFDFVNFDFVMEYIEQKHRNQNKGKELDYSLGKWLTDKNALAKPGKDLIDAVVQKFANDFLVIMQGEDEHVNRKLELYQLNKYNIEETIQNFNKWLEDERIKKEEIEKQAEITAREKIAKEEKEKLMREKARQEAEELENAYHKDLIKQAEEEEKKQEQVEKMKEVAEEVQVSAPTINVHEKKETVEMVTTSFKATGTIDNLRLLIGYAKSLNIDIQKLEEK